MLIYIWSCLIILLCWVIPWSIGIWLICSDVALTVFVLKITSFQFWVPESLTIHLVTLNNYFLDSVSIFGFAYPITCFMIVTTNYIVFVRPASAIVVSCIKRVVGVFRSSPSTSCVEDILLIFVLIGFRVRVQNKLTLVWFPD